MGRRRLGAALGLLSRTHALSPRTTPDFAARAGEQLQAFKVGINRPRSRGDRDEVFGGIGESWKGAFVGGDLFVQAVTVGPEGESERLYGNFPSYSLYPDR
jgi:hypothetical protein